MIGNHSVTVQPKLWKNGSEAITPSFGCRFTISRNWEMFARTFRWDNTTPFGSPLEPLVNSSTASSCPPRRGRPRCRVNAHHGSTATAARHSPIFFFNGGSTSSNRTRCSGHGNCSIFRSTSLAVMTVRISARRIADCSASRPAVKFRLTGTFPASSTARFASTAPLLGGSTMPTRFSGIIRRTSFDNTMAAASRVPRESVEPSIPSITAVCPIPFFNPRMQASPRCRFSIGRSS